MTAPPMHTVAMIPLPRGQELRAILTEERGERVLDLRVYGPPETPAQVRMPSGGVAVPLAHLSTLALALTETESLARSMGWLDGNSAKSALFPGGGDQTAKSAVRSEGGDA